MLSYTTVIVTYNRKNSIRNALLKQFKQTVQAKKIIVVDNNSTDGTYEYIKDILNKKNKQIKYIRLDENLGGSGGFYYGMKEAIKYKTDLIAISDDDASYSKEYFEQIIKAAEKNPKDMAFCGTIYENGKLHPMTAKYLTNENILKFKAATIEDYQHGDFYVDNWSFVGPVFRSNFVKKIGLPNKDFFIWYDDSEYAIRMHRFGYKYHVVVNARIDLNTDFQLKRTPLWKNYYGFRNEIYSVLKYSKNTFISINYVCYMLLRKYASIFIKKDEYSGRRVKAFYIFTRAFKDGILGNLGKIVKPK